MSRESIRMPICTLLVSSKSHCIAVYKIKNSSSHSPSSINHRQTPSIVSPAYKYAPLPRSSQRKASSYKKSAFHNVQTLMGCTNPKREKLYGAISYSKSSEKRAHRASSKEGDGCVPRHFRSHCPPKLQHQIQQK